MVYMQCWDRKKVRGGGIDTFVPGTFGLGQIDTQPAPPPQGWWGAQNFEGGQDTQKLPEVKNRLNNVKIEGKYAFTKLKYNIYTRI